MPSMIIVLSCETISFSEPGEEWFDPSSKSLLKMPFDFEHSRIDKTWCSEWNEIELGSYFACPCLIQNLAIITRGLKQLDKNKKSKMP